MEFFKGNWCLPNLNGIEDLRETIVKVIKNFEHNVFNVNGGTEECKFIRATFDPLHKLGDRACTFDGIMELTFKKIDVSSRRFRIIVD